MLVAEFYLELPVHEPRWIECRYERIYKFCRTCGRVGHTYPQCELSPGDARARVERVIGNLAEKFQTSVLTEPNVPLHTNCIRAFCSE